MFRFLLFEGEIAARGEFLLFESCRCKVYMLSVYAIDPL
jgi:hypothetical protein